MILRTFIERCPSSCHFTTISSVLETLRYSFGGSGGGTGQICTWCQGHKLRWEAVALVTLELEVKRVTGSFQIVLFKVCCMWRSCDCMAKIPFGKYVFRFL